MHTFITHNDLTQVIQAPTQLTVNNSSCIDIILTNIPEEITFNYVDPCIGTSDHGVACVTLHATLNQPHSDSRTNATSTLYFDTRNTDWQSVNDNFLNIDWYDLLAECTTEEGWAKFKMIYGDILRRFSRKPRSSAGDQRRSRNTQASQSQNQELARLRAIQQASWRLHSTAQTPETRQSLTAARRAYSHACENQVRQDNEIVVQRMTEANNIKQWHKYCKQLYRGTAVKEAIPILDDGNDIVTDPKEKASLLNRTFISKSRASSRPCFPTLKSKTNSVLADVFFSEDQVQMTLQNLDSSKAAGPDGIQPHVLKKCNESLSTPLTILFNRSFTEGTIPEEWKLAAVVPVYKNKGQRTDPKQYRPISLTSCVMKVMEHIINEALLQHLMQNHLIVDNQFGFLPRHSTTDQLALLIHELLAATTTRKSVAACFLDLAAAFDAVPHPAILQKLPAYGIRGHLFRWLADYLNSRAQYVVIDGSSSPVSAVCSGVPQGSVIAPSLFLLFINDLCHNLSSNSSLTHPDCHPEALVYADDTMLFRIGNDPAIICASIEEDLRIAAKWAETWGMSFNAQKTVAMFFSRVHHDPPQISFAGEALAYSANHRHLGFTLDSALTFHPHVNAIARKAASEIFLLRRLSYVVTNQDLLLKVYKMYIRPHFEYACPAWAAMTRTQSESLEKLQRRAMCVILGLPRTHHISAPDYAVLNITSLHHRRNFALSCFSYKLLNSLLPRKLLKYKPIPHVNTYNIRHRTLYAPYVTHRTLRLFDRSPFLFGIKILNSIPENFHSLSDISLFKTSLRDSPQYFNLDTIYF